MKSAAGNPVENDLPTGVKEADVSGAINESGFPLQIVVAQILTKFSANITEEWSYIDRDTKELRSLDLFTNDALPSALETVGPRLQLLIECKRSRLPWVFFRKVDERLPTDFPRITGLPADRLEIHERSTGRIQKLTIARVLGLGDFDFVAEGPPLCAAFGRTVNPGNLKLSGSDPYNRVVLPLVKAIDYAERRLRIGGAKYIAPTLLLGLAVLDTPMLLAEGPDEPLELTLCPWVRIHRHESPKEVSGFKPAASYMVDMVHVAFLADYLEEHVWPFAQDYASRAESLHGVLRWGGLVDDLSDWDWTRIEARSER